MNLQERINAFVRLGEKQDNLNKPDREKLYFNAGNHNPWFTPPNVHKAIGSIRKILNEADLTQWAGRYSFPAVSKTVGLVMAGNIPLAGFHDLLCTVISGHKAMVKPGSADRYLMQLVIDELVEIAPALRSQIQLTDRLKGMEAVIATGSDNTARYFDYYFSKYPHIIRKNRTSAGIVTGKESSDRLRALGDDIFSYFGLGCRNVSKLYVPENYDFKPFFQAIEHYSHVGNHHKYANNYDYNKAIYLVNSEEHLDNGFLLVKRSDAQASPVSVLYCEEYANTTALESQLIRHRERTQCIVADGKWWPGSVDFGEAQSPGLTDYADGVDTMEFLCSL